MQPKDNIAFGSRVTEIAAQEGIKFALPILAKIADMSLDYIENRSPWMPPDIDIDNFVGVLGIETYPLVGEVAKGVQDKLLSMEERRKAVNYSNRLPIDEVESYLASAMQWLDEEEDSSPQAYVDLFLFLCNKRRIHDGK